jgi:hypothetical protein
MNKTPGWLLVDIVEENPAKAKHKQRSQPIRHLHSWLNIDIFAANHDTRQHAKIYRSDTA